MRKIILHGKIGKKYGRVHNLAVDTVGEAIRALAANFPGILKDLSNADWHIVRGEEIDKGLSIAEDMINSLKLGNGDLHFTAAVRGSKRAGLLKIILGVALVGIGFFAGMATPILGGALGGLTYGNLALMGAAVALGGVSQLLTSEQGSGDDESSHLFGGPGNVYEQGNPIPLVYGHDVITGGVLVSAGMNIESIGTNSTNSSK